MVDVRDDPELDKIEKNWTKQEKCILLNSLLSFKVASFWCNQWIKLLILKINIVFEAITHHGEHDPMVID